MKYSKFGKSLPNAAMLDFRSSILYIRVHPFEEKGGFVHSKQEINRQSTSNLAIYHIPLGTQRYLFEDGEVLHVHQLIFEQDYHAENKQMILNSSSSNIINNIGIEQRTPADKLFAITDLPKGKYGFWVSDKEGKHKQLLHTYGKGVLWQLDIKNKKVLFVSYTNNKIQVDAYDW